MPVGGWQRPGVAAGPAALCSDGIAKRRFDVSRLAADALLVPRRGTGAAVDSQGAFCHMGPSSPVAEHGTSETARRAARRVYAKGLLAHVQFQRHYAQYPSYSRTGGAVHSFQ